MRIREIKVKEVKERTREQRNDLAAIRMEWLENNSKVTKAAESHIDLIKSIFQN